MASVPWSPPSWQGELGAGEEAICGGRVPEEGAFPRALRIQRTLGGLRQAPAGSGPAWTLQLQVSLDKVVLPGHGASRAGTPVLSRPLPSPDSGRRQSLGSQHQL